MAQEQPLAQPEPGAPRGLVPTVGEEAAWRRLHRERRGVLGLFRLFRGAGRAPSRDGVGRLPKLELVWLPGFHVIHSVIHRRAATELHTLVGVQDRDVAILDTEKTRWQSVADRELFRPGLTPEEADRLSRDALLHGVLRRGTARLAETITVTTAHHPFWAYYHERRRGRLDVKLLDAVSGSVAGPRARAAFLAVLAREMG